MIRVETGGRTFLAYCPECPSFRALRMTRAAALRAGAEHLSGVHGNADAASDARERATRLTGDTPH